MVHGSPLRPMLSGDKIIQSLLSSLQFSVAAMRHIEECLPYVKHPVLPVGVVKVVRGQLVVQFVCGEKHLMDQ